MEFKEKIQVNLRELKILLLNIIFDWIFEFQLKVSLSYELKITIQYKVKNFFNCVIFKIRLE